MGELYHNNDDFVSVQMLGGFELRSGGHVVNENSSRSYQLWNLLEYLIAHRHQDVSQAKIIDALWPDDSSDNPANALKNLVYRIRSAIFSVGFPNGKDIVKYANGTYSFNNELNCTVDVEEFEILCKQSEAPGLSMEVRENLLYKAIELYKGDFLPRSKYEPWVVPISTYYRGLYMRSVLQLIKLLKAQQKHSLIASVCERALLVDQFEEFLHEELIRSLIAQNKQKQAMERYQQTTDLFYRGMGVKLSENMRGLYREIIKTVNAVETDLEVIKEDLREMAVGDGAFLCEYEIFRSMYRLEARSAARSGQAIFLGLLTMVSADHLVPDSKVVNAAMDCLLEALQRSLRLGDVVCQFSATQYLVMLPTLTYENGQAVLARVSRRFSTVFRNPILRLQITLQPMEPVMDGYPNDLNFSPRNFVE